MGGEAAEAVEAMDPGGVIAGAVAQDGVARAALSRSQTITAPRLTPPGCGVGASDQAR